MKKNHLSVHLAGLLLPLALAAGCSETVEEVTAQPAVSPAALNSPLTPDINRDGSADLLWQNPATGQMGYWLLNGTQYSSLGLFVDGANNPMQVATGWYAVASADVDNNGSADLIWHNRSTGQVGYWLMQNGQLLRITLANGSAPRPWYLVAANDFDKDGNVDLIWQYRVLYPTSPNLGIWYMGATPASGNVPIKRTDNLYVNYPNATALTQGMPVVPVGAYDMDGDGTPDLVNHNRSDGGVTIMYLRYDQQLARVYLVSNYYTSAIAYTPSGWTLAGAADYDKNGQIDMVLHNRQTGQVKLWLLNPGAANRSHLEYKGEVMLSTTADPGWYLGSPDCETWTWVWSTSTSNCPVP